MKLHDSLRISASGLSAERLRMDVISSNVANANTTRSPQGGPYRRQVALLASESPESQFKNALSRLRSEDSSVTQGVRIAGIKEDSSPNKRVYDPKHPDANDDGFVEYPNVDVMKEMVELITASRAYDANITVMNNTKNMLFRTLEIGQR